MLYERLCKDIGGLVLCGDEHDVDGMVGHHLSYIMILYINMLCPLMVFRVLDQVKTTLVVAEKANGVILRISYC